MELGAFLVPSSFRGRGTEFIPLPSPGKWIGMNSVLHPGAKSFRPPFPGRVEWISCASRPLPSGDIRMSLSFLPTTEQIKECFARETEALGGTVSDVFDDGRRLFMRSVLPGV